MSMVQFEVVQTTTFGKKNFTHLLASCVPAIPVSAINIDVPLVWKKQGFIGRLNIEHFP
jgi:hypothetical protein